MTVAPKVSFVDDKGNKVEVKGPRWIKLKSLSLSVLEKIEFECEEIIDDTDLNSNDKLVMKVNVYFNLLGRVLSLIMKYNDNLAKLIAREFINHLIKAFDLNENDLKAGE